MRARRNLFCLLLTSAIATVWATRCAAVEGVTHYSTMTSVNAIKEGDATFIDFDLNTRTYAAIATSGTSVNITFANTRPAPNLAEHIDMDNSLGRLAVNARTGERNSTTVSLTLAAAMDATLAKSPDGDGIRLTLMPSATSQAPVVSMVSNSQQARIADATATPAVEAAGANNDSNPHLYDLDAYDSDVASLFKSLATQSQTNIVLIGSITAKVTIHFSQTPIDRAIDMLAKAAGLSYHVDNGTYFIGTDKDITTDYPGESTHYPTSERVYECNYVDATSLAGSLLTVFDKTLLHVTFGAMERTTSLSGSGASQAMQGGSSGGSSTPTSSGDSTPSSLPASEGSLSGSSTNTGRESREVILSGDANLVDQAYALCGQLDRRRKQIKIDMELTDVSLGDLKQLGIQWAFPQFTVPNTSGIAPSFQATMSALEDANKAKLLASPSIALLDGEQGYILIGQRVSYPLLTGYSQASTPIFSVGQEEVGIYLQVQAQITADNEIMLSVYPQVSSITGYLNVNGASYPQVSTREQQTTVRVHSGDKVVIGGLINDQDTKDFQSVPFLSQIPFFGALFKYHNNNKTRDEVIMTITPQVVEE